MPATRYTKMHCYIDWSRTGVYHDETARLASASGTWRRNNPEDSITSPRGIVNQATITLINHDARFSTTNDEGPLKEYVMDGGYYQAPMFLTIEEDLLEERIFTGVIKGPQEIGGSLDGIGQVTFDCRGLEELLLQQRLSTLQTDLKTYNEAGRDEFQVILEWLRMATLPGMTFEGLDTDLTGGPGSFVIPWVWLDNESVLEDIWQLAAAGGGAFYGTPDGKFHYENMAGWLDDVESSTYELFTGHDYRRGTVRINDDELYQTVIVEVASRDIAGSAVVWDSPERASVPADSTRVIVANLQQPLYQLDNILFDAASSGGLDMSPYIDATWSYTAYAQHIDMTFTNTSTGHDAILRNFRIVGKALTGGPISEVERVSGDEFWDNRSGRTRTISNPYIQTQAQAEALAEFLLDRHELPRVFYTLYDCPGKTSRYLGMRIVLALSSLVSEYRPALITGITWRWSKDGGYTQTLEAFDCMNLFEYAVTDTVAFSMTAERGYFRLDQSLVSDGVDANDHRLFY